MEDTDHIPFQQRCRSGSEACISRAWLRRFLTQGAPSSVSRSVGLSPRAWMNHGLRAGEEPLGPHITREHEELRGSLSRGSTSPDASPCEEGRPLPCPKSTSGLDLSLGDYSRPGLDHVPWGPGSGHVGCWDVLNSVSGAGGGVT